MPKKIFIAAWNAQGFKSTLGKWGTWGVLVNTYMLPTINSFDRCLGMMAESGHPFSTPPETYAITEGEISSVTFSAKYYWYGWDKGGALPNPRCSLTALIAGNASRLPSLKAWRITPWGDDFADDNCRPAMRYSIFDGGFYIYLVHLNGLDSSTHQDKLNSVCVLHERSFQGQPAVVVGDMNIDLLKKTYTPPNKWALLKTNLPTQTSGGELDWGLAYGCKTSKVTQIGPLSQFTQQTGTGLVPVGQGVSDHAVLGYCITIQ